MFSKKVYLIGAIICSFTLYSTSIFSQESLPSQPSTSEDIKTNEIQPDTSVQKTEEVNIEQKDQDSSKKEATTESSKDSGSKQTLQEQKPSLVQTPEEAKLSKKDINQLISDDVSVHLDLGLATNIKISSNSLLRSQLSGISLFIKLMNFSQDLSLLLNSRYSSVIAETGSSKTKFNAKVESLSVGSSVKYKLNKHFSILAGLDLGVNYGKKYVLSDNNSSFVKVLIGGISAINYSFSLNPNLNVGFKFNVNLGSISNLQTLLYVGLTF